ncbi:alginate lyase-domain-containing protein [Gloeopeniophorella convolvens]|nr:alginate lyase-domain-containing protein [Gloeopeniophorella convolvens]
MEIAGVSGVCRPHLFSSFHTHTLAVEMAPLRALVLSLLAALPAVRSLGSLNVGFSSYDNDFVDPSYVLNKNWTNTTVVAQESIVQWADFLAAQGPWSVVTSKPFLAPSNDSHDYLSWAPYWWPECSGVGNTTELTPQQIWTTCKYVSRDGQFNPDVRTVNNTGAFSAFSDAVFYNALAWAINGSSVYSTNIANWVDTWFLAPDTHMNPNLNYAQVIRGPGSGFGAHTGVLDLKCMAKVATAVLVLRQGKAPEWNSTVDSGLVSWTNQYIQWLTTSSIALDEAASTNPRVCTWARGWATQTRLTIALGRSNHGSYYYTQLASLQIIANDLAGANASLQKYFSTLYLNQVDANGEQPLEAVRTRPYHYRSYNLAAMITNARLAAYVGFDAWNLTTTKGGTIKAAVDFTIGVPPGDDAPAELFPDVGAGAAVYGDPNGTYAAFLSHSEQGYPVEPWFFWNQPLSDSGWVRANAGSSGAATPSSSAGSKPTGGSSKSSPSSNGAGRVGLDFAGRLGTATAALALVHMLL